MFENSSSNLVQVTIKKYLVYYSCSILTTIDVFVEINDAFCDQLLVKGQNIAFLRNALLIAENAR